MFDAAQPRLAGRHDILRATHHAGMCTCVCNVNIWVCLKMLGIFPMK